MSVPFRTIGKARPFRSKAHTPTDLSAFCWRYAQGHYGKGLFWHSSELLFAFFLTEQAGFPAVWMGIVLIAGLVSSAGIDLLVGYSLRRRPFTTDRALKLQMAGAVASALSIIALFATDLLPQGARIPYALAAALAFRIAYAFYDIPQNALLALAAPDADTRAWLASLRLAFSGLAAITVATILTALLSGAHGARAGRFAIAALIMSFVAVGTAWRVAQGRVPAGAPPAPAPTRSRRFPSLEMASLLAAMGFASFAISLFTTLEPFYVANAAVGAPRRSIVLAAAVGLTVSQILWLKVVRRWSAGKALSGALVGMAASIWLFGSAGLGDVGQIVTAGLFGVANGGVGMALWTRFADFVSRRSAGGDPFAFALLTCVAKLGIAAASGTVAHILSLHHGLDGAEQLIQWGMTWPPIATLGIALLALFAAGHALRTQRS